MKAEIQILTPVHIGSGHMLVKDVDFIIDNKNLGTLDQEAILNAIGTEHVSDWAVAISAGNTIQEVINRYAPGTSPMSLCGHITPVNYRSPQVTQLRTCVRTTGNPYIPGSSVKGAIRTGLLAAVANSQVREKDDIVKKNFKGKWEFKDQIIQKKVFGSDPNHDLLRFLRIGDAHFKEEQLVVYEALILNHKSGHNGGRWEYKPGLAMLYECLKPGANATFTLSHAGEHMKLATDKREIRQAPEWMRSLENALKQAHDRTLYLINREIEDWTDQTREDGDNEKAEDYLELLKELKTKAEQFGDRRYLLRIGAHSGWNFTTGRWAFIQDENILPDDLYDEMLRQIQKRDYGNSYAVFPKTRKLMANDTLPGFISINLNA